ncbi:MAG: GDP-L-fucose synthase [Bacteroidota bacterium]|jgi:nucleoside-diphosphate-sugar epimerase
MILVTGATGLVGAHLLLHLLEKKQTVRAMYRNAASIAKTKVLFEKQHKLSLFEQIEWVQADITNLPQLEIAFQEINQVYHCAGSISFDPSDEEKLRKINIEGTANVVNLCLAHAVQKLCFVSSIATIGVSPLPTLPCDETHEWNPELPHTDYAISKYGAEMEVWRGYQEGLPVVIVNPGVIIGPYFWESGSGELFAKVAQKFPFYSSGSTGFIGVSDVVQPMVQLMESTVSGERYILVSENKTYATVLKEIALEMNTSIRWIAIRKWMIALAWRMEAMAEILFGKKRVLSKQLAHSLFESTSYTSAKIKGELGIAFSPINQVIQKTAKEFLTA